MRNILLGLAVICFVIVVVVGLVGGNTGSINFTALGLAFFAGSFLVDT